jgi:hypothetical protein
VADGAGGAIVAWTDSRGGATSDIYAQHVFASGVVDGSWPLDGRGICAATGSQSDPHLVADSFGGAFLTWHDLRSGPGSDLYAQHVLAAGTLDVLWPVDGRALSLASNNQESPRIVADGAGGVIVSWQDMRTGALDVHAQRVGRHGYLGTPEPVIVSVADVPNDQGGRVKLSWAASWLDHVQDPNLDAYDVYRSVPPNNAQVPAASRFVRAGDALPSDHDELLILETTATTYAWEFLATVEPNHFAGQYSLLAATASDSVGGSNPKTMFLVLGRNASGSMFWPSPPDSGYSVDDLAPAAPAALSGEFVAGTATLHWQPNTEADLAGYRIYRGLTPDFVPDEDNLVASVPDTGHVDIAGNHYDYKVTAVDTHGNESPVASVFPSGIVDGGDVSLPVTVSFAGAMPSPTRSATNLRYALPRPATVQLAVYDAGGRLVRRLVHGPKGAGEHSEIWDLRNADGRIAAAGIYFARLEVEDLRLVRRVAITP